MGKPAARVTDMHVCPKKTGKIPHVGGPIVTGSPDVLIGGLPAARVGDTVACVGPPDKVAAGSSGVLINGSPAARLGDSTAHGGKIVGGCSTVLIGDGGGGQTLDQEAIDVMNAHQAQMRAEIEAAELRAARRAAGVAEKTAAVTITTEAMTPRQRNIAQRKQNYQQRKQMAARAGDSPAQRAAAARLLDNNDNILRAESAAYVYPVDEFNRGHIDKLPEAPVGLNLMDPKEISGLEEATFTDEETGFGAALFESDINGETMLTYRGTNNGVTGKKDWATNFSQGIGQETDQYDQAMRLARMTKKRLGRNFVTVGHSLGGGLASAATAVTGAKGFTFNAAGLHSNTAARKGGMSNEAADRRIQTRAVEGDVLTGAQRHGNAALSGLGAGGGALLAGPAGAGIGYLASKALPDVPEALGEMKTLPSVNGGSPVARHGMDQVIAGIEAQKREDIQTLTAGTE